jgi:peptidase M42 family hydrolase
MQQIDIDKDYLLETLLALLNIHSPTGMCDQIVHYVGSTLEEIGIDFNVTRRGAIRATLAGEEKNLDRALAVHLDTLGAMVCKLKQNGRLGILPVGTWPARMAEGGRVTIFNEMGPSRGTVMPLMASGHVYAEKIDTQTASWANLEVRVDDHCDDRSRLIDAGFDVGDFVAFDALAEFSDNGYINARHLDDKAGVAIVLALAKAITESGVYLPLDCHLLFTITEEVGSGASAAVYQDVAELVVIDHGPVAPVQNGSELDLIICMMDQAGPFDYHLNRKLIQICRKHQIEHRKDVFRHYRSDSASAIAAGNDTRTALACFGVDGSHGYERTHIKSLVRVAQLMALYLQSPLTFKRDGKDMAPLNGFPHQPTRDTIQIET